MAARPLEAFTTAVVERDDGDRETADVVTELRHSGITVTTCSVKDLARGRLMIDRSTIAIGGLPFVAAALGQLGTKVPAPSDYPVEIGEFLGRAVRSTTVGSLRRQVDGWPMFVKPRDARKRFTGRVFDSPDAWPLTTLPDQLPVWSCEPVGWLSEWRAFVVRGEVLWIANY